MGCGKGVASVQLTSNDLLRVGDWIEMPQVGADGDVIDITLHTVKVQNFDKTIVSIPTWRLMSESFKNWRGMQQSGGRRIKRSLFIDASDVAFLTDEQEQRLEGVRLLSDYLHRKKAELKSWNEAQGNVAAMSANRRRMTNIGTFRAYALAYLKSHAFSQAWGSELVWLENAGHINGEGGFGTWPQGIELLFKLTGDPQFKHA